MRHSAGKRRMPQHNLPHVHFHFNEASDKLPRWRGSSASAVPVVRVLPNLLHAVKASSPCGVICYPYYVLYIT